ncbi:MAG TPA: hypothetical protein VMR21_07145 [Vicinamibacteria bacterium]|nr:hypothetical protein [Vicinamibacteria bacterium]
MLCNRCENELPAHTPVCPACGPFTLGVGFVSPSTPLPVSHSPGKAVPFDAQVLFSASPIALTAGPAAIPAAIALPATLTAAAAAIIPPPPLPGRPSPGTGQGKATGKRARREKQRAAMASAKAAKGQAAGARLARPAAGEPVRRPGAVTLLATMDLGLGAAYLIVAWAALSGRLGAVGGAPADQVEAVLSGAHGLLLASASLWLLSLHPMGRYAQLALAGLGIFGGFVSALASLPLIVYFFRPGVKLLFSGRDLGHLSDDERDRVLEHAPSPLLVPSAVALQLLRSGANLLPVLAAMGAG